MLRSLAPLLTCPACWDEKQGLELQVFSEKQSSLVQDGVLICRACGGWYPIEAGLLEFLPASLAYDGRIQEFCQRFRAETTRLDLDLSAREKIEGRNAEEVVPQLQQRSHFDRWSDNTEQTYDEYESMPFWRGVDAQIFARWKSMMRPGSLLLDVACGNGRSAIPYKENVTVIGFDISRKAIGRAIARAEEVGAQETTTFFVADGSRLPFKNNSFDYVQTYGALHHLPNPGPVSRDIQRVLRDGGIHFGMENNKTVLRAFFDRLMKFVPLWVEEAGDEPLISAQMVEEWTSGCPTKITTQTSVFLPPHLFNLFGVNGARRLLALSDGVLASLPGIKHHGGLIYFEIRKSDSQVAAVSRERSTKL